jgi:uridine kinase
MDVQPVLDALVRLAPDREPTLVGIGGHGGAGKSTLAAALPATAVVGTDEFWDGASFDLGRLHEEVFEPLLAGRPAVYRSFDWDARRPRDEPRVVASAGLVVVEGVCALHRRFRDAYDLRVWVDAPRDLRLARGVARDGEEARRRWLDVWMPREDRYVEGDDPVSAADLVVDGSGEPP